MGKAMGRRPVIGNGVFEEVELSSIYTNFQINGDENCKKSTKHSFVYDLIVIFAANLQK